MASVLCSMRGRVGAGSEVSDPRGRAFGRRNVAGVRTSELQGLSPLCHGCCFFIDTPAECTTHCSTRAGVFHTSWHQGKLAQVQGKESVWLVHWMAGALGAVSPLTPPWSSDYS